MFISYPLKTMLYPLLLVPLPPLLLVPWLSFQSARDKKCHLTHFSSPAPTHPMHVLGCNTS